MSLTRVRKAATALLTGAALSMSVLAATPSTAEAAYYNHGCPRGGVCIYSQASWNYDRPTHVFYDYGVHRFYGQYGLHRVFNNQYGGAKAALSRDTDGSPRDVVLEPGDLYELSLTRMNSIVLYPG